MIKGVSEGVYRAFCYECTQEGSGVAMGGTHPAVRGDCDQMVGEVHEQVAERPVQEEVVVVEAHRQRTVVSAVAPLVVMAHEGPPSVR